MARKQVNGQLDLFAYINSIQTTEHFGDMEMVSLMPEDVEETAIAQPDDSDSQPEIIEEEFQIDISPSAVYNEKEENTSDLVMAKYFVSQNNEEAFVEYRNYNRVIIRSIGEEVKEYHFDSSKEAVDFYVNIMYHFLDDKNLKEKDV